MTLQDYLNQQEPKFLPIGTVGVPSTNIWHKSGESTFYSIEMLGQTFDYVQYGNSNTLYTYDSDGNKLKPTVFFALPTPPTEAETLAAQVL